MRREFSAGVVLVRRMRGRWWLAAVRPRGKREGIWVLPKGLVDEGESPADTALREGYEETGVHARLGSKLGDVRYVYTWRGREFSPVPQDADRRDGSHEYGALTVNWDTRF